MEGHRVKLTEVNPYLVCVLCHGYLVDATTIAECLHSFCRSCIFRQLERKSICPICETHVHNTKIYRSLRPDKTLQDIVYKLVPGLFHTEMQRRRDFYKNHPFRDDHLESECRGVGLDRLIYSPDDQISLSLEFYDEEREKEEWSNNSSPNTPQFAPSGPKRYLQCPAGFKMFHLKKFLRQKYGLNSKCNVDIMYRRECLPDSYSLMDVAYIYTWKRNSPMRFYYRMPEVVMKYLIAPPPKLPSIESTKDEDEPKEEKESVTTSSVKMTEVKQEENKEENKKEKKEEVAAKAVLELEKIEAPEKEKVDSEKKEEEKPKPIEVAEQQPNSISSSRPLSKQDELSVSVLLSLGQCRVGNKDDHKFLVPNPVTPKNGIVEKKNGKVSPKPSVNKIASDLAEHKAQQPQPMNTSPPILPSPLSSPNQQLTISPQQKQQQLQKQKQLQQMQQQKQKQQLKNQQLQQQKQQQFLHQKQQIHQLMQHQQQKFQQQLQQQHLLQQQQLQQIHLQQVQRHQLQQLQAQQPQILQLQVQPHLQLQQVLHQINEAKPQDQQPTQVPLQQQPLGEQPVAVASQIKQVSNQMLKVSKSPPVLHQSPVQPQLPQNIQQSPLHSSQQQSKQQMLQQPQNLTQQQSQQILVQQQQPQQQSMPQLQPQQQSMPQPPQQQPTQTPVQPQLPHQTLQQQSTQQSVQQQQQQQQSVQQQPSQQSVQAQPQQSLLQKSQNQQAQSHQPSQHQKPWPEPAAHENPTTNGTTSVQNPQVTLNTSNGSVTIMAQLKTPPIVSSKVGGSVNSPASPIPTMNGKLPDTPRPQGIHQNLPRTVLPKSPFVNGKPLQKSIQQKNISGQRLNNNLPEGKNGLIQQSNINNRLPTFQKNGGGARKAGIPGGVISKTGPTLDQRIQQLYNSGPANKPPSPGGKSESRLASWLNNRFKPQPAKEEPESTTPASPPATKEVSMQRYKRKLQEMQKVQEICEITQENPKPDDAKRRREVTPDVSIELMRAADMKKLDNSKKEKRPVPGLKSIQDVGGKRKKEDDAGQGALDLSRPQQLPWLMPTHLVPSPRPT